MKFFLTIFALFCASSNAIVIHCEHEYSGWAVIGAVSACSVRSVNSTLNLTHITGVTGMSSLENVKRVDFSCNYYNLNLNVFPLGFNEFFPNLIGIDFHKCSIESLTGNELENYPNLEWFSIASSKSITRIPGNFFSFNQKLKLVGFFSNAINHVGDGLLDNLPDLNWAWFQGNVCIDQRVNNKSEIPALIEALRQNCPDIEPETTTTISTTSNQPPKCEIDDLEDFVCGLEEEIEILREENQNLKIEVGSLKSEMKEVREILYELEKIIQELTSKPCACK